MSKKINKWIWNVDHWEYQDCIIMFPQIFITCNIFIESQVQINELEFYGVSTSMDHCFGLLLSNHTTLYGESINDAVHFNSFQSTLEDQLKQIPLKSRFRQSYEYIHTHVFKVYKNRKVLSQEINDIDNEGDLEYTLESKRKKNTIKREMSIPMQQFHERFSNIAFMETIPLTIKKKQRL